MIGRSYSNLRSVLHISTFFVGVGLLGYGTYVSSVSTLAWLVSSRGLKVMASLRLLFVHSSFSCI